MMSDEMVAELESSLYGRIAELRAQLAERGMELVIKEMRIDSLTAALDDMRNRWKSAEQDWMQLRAQLAERDATIADLRAQVSNRSVTLARYKHAYQAEKNMFADCETLRQAEMATVAELRAQVASWVEFHKLQSALPSREEDDATIAELRAQVATLTERLGRCTCTDDYGDEAP